MNAYAYDSANRLKSAINPSTVSSYGYNGLGDRLSQTVNGVTTNYTLDLNAGLTQVLNDGTNAYVYGLGRIAQVNATTEYFLGDALGSVRQMVNASGTITLAKGYTPYGEVMSTAGSGTSIYAYTGEQTDVSGLTYLRARYYASYLNQFIQPDTIVPDPYIPADWNKYSYVWNNPVNFTDPSGRTLFSPYSQSDLNKCVASQQLQGVNISVRYDVCKMIPELETAGFLEDVSDQDHITGGYREPKDAHRFSTAYHIIHDHISIEDLADTPSDSDRNVWYKDEWEYLFPECSSVNVVLGGLLEYRVKKNASNLSSETHNGKYVLAGIWFVQDVNYALEGYLSSSPSRLPNTDQPGISKHTTGLAVDIDAYWAIPREQRWAPAINDIARRFNLVRPYHNLDIDYADVTIDETWHFERP